MRTTILACVAAALTAALAAAAPAPVAPRDTDPWWSPQGTTLAFARASPTTDAPHVLFTPATRGAETDLIGEGRPRGFRSGSGELLVEQGDETTVRDAATRTLGRIPGTDASWSPDGSRVAFLQGSTLSVSAPSGDDVHALVEGVVPPASDSTGPVWSPDGTTLAIAAGSAIVAAAADGTGTHVVFDQPGDNVNPSWSHDGTTIAFERLAGGRWSIWLVSADGTGAREAPVAATANSRFPQWSPVDGRLAFLSDRGGGYALYVGSPDEQPRLLVQAVTPESPARWSPDGSKLAVASAADCARFGIYVVPASGAADAVRRSNQCRVDGTGGADVVRGSPYADRIFGNGGDDRLFGYGGDDTIDGGAGNDGIGGGPGNDVIAGGAGNDILSGGTGNDVIVAGPGRDKVGCGPGVDRVYLQRGDTERDCERVIRRR
jgi:Tol biopolymer transport system component